MKYCKKCLMPNTRPRITFDPEGVCNACRYQESKEKIDWAARARELITLCDLHRSNNGEYDCVVPWSGGKDSSTIAYKLKTKYGMNPLLACVSPMLPTAVGNANRETFLNLGFDYVLSRPNQKVHRYLARKFFIERGNPKAAWDAQVNSFPAQVAVQNNIKLVFYAEHGESEYGGEILHKDSSKTRDAEEVYQIQLGDDPRDWSDDTVQKNDLNPYLYPVDGMLGRGIKAYYYAWFEKWHMCENYKFAKDHWDFREATTVDGTWNGWDSIDDKMDPLYYHMQYVKYGFGKALRDAARMIQGGYMGRRKALGLIERNDSEFPETDFEEVCEYLGMPDVRQMIESHRNKDLFVKRDWVLRNPLPKG
ncbi:MAG: N-acetyl sugar amidotransferase [FCB group bacterium]|nr:N-acetyl sugar amidotransferase [FCB group bacterium]